MTSTDEELVRYLSTLKTQAGRDIHLSGGAGFARSMIALDLVDEFLFFLYPIVLPGVPWFVDLQQVHPFQLIDAKMFSNGVICLHYLPKRMEPRAQPESFTDLLT